MREVCGHSVGNMKVRVHDKRPRDELTETHSCTDFAVAGQDALAIVTILAHFMGGMQTQSSKLAGFSISCTGD